jgi:hypothetical protein
MAIPPPERGLQQDHAHRQQMGSDGGRQRGQGEVIDHQSDLHPQIQQRQQQQQDRDQGQGSPWLGRPGAGTHRRAATSRVGATPMLDQLPTATPMARATANQNRLLPPSRITPSRGSSVVKEV